MVVQGNECLLNTCGIGQWRYYGYRLTAAVDEKVLEIEARC
jgi:hypothetical protein